MKPTQSQLYFLGGTLFWLGVLQISMFWHLAWDSTLVCNGGGAWPFSEWPGLGSGLLTLAFTSIVGFWAWHTLKNTLWPYKLSWLLIGAWALIVGSGLSHTVERLTSQCVLDYWRFSWFDPGFYFNLGDLALTAAALTLIILGWRERNSQ